MSKQNLKRHCAVLLSALFSSTFMVNANEIENVSEDKSVSKSANIDEINNRNDIDNKNKGLSAPVKIGLGLGGAAIIGAGKLGYDYYPYKKALDEIRSTVLNAQDNGVKAAQILRVENSNLTWGLKTHILKLMKTEQCWDMAVWLIAKLEKMSKLDQMTKFSFLEADTFIDACKGFENTNQKDHEKDYTIDLCMRFILGYLEYSNESLFSKPPTSFDQIPNWKIIKEIISGSLDPVEQPKLDGNVISFSFQSNKGGKFTLRIVKSTK